MTQRLTITIADKVFDKINAEMIYSNVSNRSEFVEELIRESLDRRKQNE